jgi:hypothetical protein
MAEIAGKLREVFVEAPFITGQILGIDGGLAL